MLAGKDWKDFQSCFYHFYVGTHDVCQERLILVTMCILDDRGEHFPIGHALMPTERVDMVKVLFQELHNLEEEPCSKVKVFMSDLTHVFHNAWAAVTQHPPTYEKCAWHLEQAWKKNFKHACNVHLYNKMWRLRTEGNVANFWATFHILKNTWLNPQEAALLWPNAAEREHNMKYAGYFFKHYGEFGM
jgi:hypothetical protein